MGSGVHRLELEVGPRCKMLVHGKGVSLICPYMCSVIFILSLSKDVSSDT